MTKLIRAALAAAALFAAPAAQGQTLTEGFDPFAGWQTRWFGAQSNAANYYTSEFGDPVDYQGAPDVGGLWLSDGDSYRDPGDYQSIAIRFADGFAAQLTGLSLDVASAVSGVQLSFFDRAGNALATSAVVQSADSSLYGTPLGYSRYAVTSANGIGGFSFTSPAQGNLIVDNIAAAAVPEPAAWGLMILGLGAVGATMRRRRIAVLA